MPFEWGGRGGGLFVGYQRAADLSEWHIRRREETLGDPVSVLIGALDNIDEFWIGNGTFTVRLRMSRCDWVWDAAILMTTDPLLMWVYGDPRSEPRR